MSKKLVYLILFILISYGINKAQTIAYWPFDEQKGIYPSSVISDVSDNDYPLVIGPGGMIVDGKYGNALEAKEQPKIKIDTPEKSLQFGLVKIPIPQGRTVGPMTWYNANFAALMTKGENHLRKQVGFVNPTDCDLNLADFDWTVEFWMNTNKKEQAGVIFEIGEGPRGENNHVTSLNFDPSKNIFTFTNQPSNTKTNILVETNATERNDNKWHHFAFEFSSRDNLLYLFVDGKKQQQSYKIDIKKLNHGDKAYMSIGRDGMWNNPMPGKIDELKFSKGIVYLKNFDAEKDYKPFTFSHVDIVKYKKGLLPLFPNGKNTELPLQYGSRKHLFVDDAIIAEMKDIKFVANPPKLDSVVIDDIKGTFRKHLNVLEDEEGLIRIYNAVDNDYMAVHVSKDGVHFYDPNLQTGTYKNKHNIVLHEPTGMGMVFIDPNAPDKEKYKFLSDFHRRGIFLYTSPDGWLFKRKRIAVLPFRSGSQSQIFYDEQKQIYDTYHRCDFGATVSGETERDFAIVKVKDINKPWPFTPLTQKEAQERANKIRNRGLVPWYLDNGPLTPGGFSVEYPWVFTPKDSLDPEGTDIYVPKAIKYPWAPDTYLAFPLIYFHYENEGPKTRHIYWDDPSRMRGSGPIESQVSVSRNGEDWKRYPRPAYIGIGSHGQDTIHQVYTAQGMVKRGNEIWQYYFGEERYHSSYQKDNYKRAVYRTIQRIDGFVSADSPYGHEGYLITKPLIFKGSKLYLNIDTDAAGYAQVGFLDKNGDPIPEFSVDDCIYINGDFFNTEVEWLKKGKDISELSGKEVQIVFRMRGTKLYAMNIK